MRRLGEAYACLNPDCGGASWRVPPARKDAWTAAVQQMGTPWQDTMACVCWHAEQIAGVLSCVDRVIVQSTLPVFCYADGMAAYLSKRRILHRLRTHGLIKKASHCYKYYLTALGKQVVAGPQTQGACHYSRTCGGALPLISKFCQFRQELNYVGTNGRGSADWATQPIGINFSTFKSRTLRALSPASPRVIFPACPSSPAWKPTSNSSASARIGKRKFWRASLPSSPWLTSSS